MTTLNVDVLSIVCDFLTAAADILSFALTCSSLRPVANKRLLDSRTIGLTDSKAIRDFHSFLFADADARTPHVRALRLDLELDLDSQRGASRTTHQPDPLSTLIDILTSCPHLEHIELFIADWYSGAEDSRVIDTIATIPSLRSLSVYGSAMQALTLLRETCAPLRMAGIHFRNLPGECWHPAALESTLSLTRLAPTLEDLKIAYFMVDREGIQALLNISTPSVFEMAQYPGVRSLAIACFMREPRLDHLQHLFPALAGTLSLGKLDTSLPRNSYARIRAANQRVQQDAPSRAWKKLDRVRVCDGPMFYVLGLLCPVRLVILEYPSSHTELHYAREVLRENPVSRLKLSSTFTPQVHILDKLLSPELARALTHLTVCLIYSNGEGPRAPGEAEAFAQLKWGDLLCEILSALQQLCTLTHLRVVVHATIYHGGSWAAPYSENFIAAIRRSAFNFDETAVALARPLPSLQFLAFTTSGYLTRQLPQQSVTSGRSWTAYDRWNVIRAWRVAAHRVAQDSDPVIVSLHEEVAETIMRREELVLSETDEAWLHLQDN